MVSSTEHVVPNTNYEDSVTYLISTPGISGHTEVTISRYVNTRFITGNTPFTSENSFAGGNGYGSKIPKAERTKIEGAARKNAILGPKRSRWSR